MTVCSRCLEFHADAVKVQHLSLQLQKPVKVRCSIASTASGTPPKWALRQAEQLARSNHGQSKHSDTLDIAHFDPTRSPSKPPRP